MFSLSIGFWLFVLVLSACLFDSGLFFLEFLRVLLCLLAYALRYYPLPTTSNGCHPLLRGGAPSILVGQAEQESMNAISALTSSFRKAGWLGLMEINQRV